MLRSRLTDEVEQLGELLEQLEAGARTEVS
jgi:hypothetical protein